MDVNLSQVQAYKLGYRQGFVAGLGFAFVGAVVVATGRVLVLEKFKIQRKVTYSRD